jgi:hypothetical protein
MFDVEVLIGLELVAFRKFLKHCGVVLHIVACNMSDLCLISK